MSGNRPTRFAIGAQCRRPCRGRRPGGLAGAGSRLGPGAVRDPARLLGLQRPDRDLHHLEGEDLRQLPRPGPGDGLPRRYPGGGDRRRHDPRRLAALARRVATSCSTTCSPTRPSRWSPGSPSTPRSRDGISNSEPAFYALIFAVFLLALAINFTMIASYSCYLDRSSFFLKVRTALIPLLPSELAAALMACGVAYLYVEVGLAGVALFGVVLVTFQYLLGALLVSQQRAEELELRSKQLASFQVGMLSAMLRTLDLRDQMTARHSRRRGALLAGDRPAGRLLAPRGGAGPHRRAAARHRQVHPSRPHPQGQRAAHRRGLDADQAPPAAGRPRRLLARRLRPGRRDHPRPPRADRRQRLSARPGRRRHSRTVPDHLRRRHLRRDDRARLLPHADVEPRRDRRAAPGRRQTARRPLRRGLHRAARGQGRLLPARRGGRLREGAGARIADRRDGQSGRRAAAASRSPASALNG